MNKSENMSQDVNRRWKQYKQDFLNGKSWNRLEELLDGIQSDLDADVLYEIARLRSVITYVRNLVEQTDSQHVPQDTWKKLNGSIQRCSQYLSSPEVTLRIAQDANGAIDDFLRDWIPYATISY